MKEQIDAPVLYLDLAGESFHDAAADAELVPAGFDEVFAVRQIEVERRGATRQLAFGIPLVEKVLAVHVETGRPGRERSSVARICRQIAALGRINCLMRLVRSNQANGDVRRLGVARRQ